MTNSSPVSAVGARVDNKQTLGDLVIAALQAAWRRRWLIAIPIMILVPLTIAAALLLPRTYASTALLLLQEDVGGNALEKSENRLRETRQRAAALERLVLSDRVLSQALPGVYGEALATNPKQRALQRKELREALTVSVEGGQFIEISLKDNNPNGLGERLDAVLVAFFDSLLLPVSDTRTAPNYMVEKKAAAVLEAEQQRDELVRSSSNLSLEAIARKREEIQSLDQGLAEARSRLTIAKRQSDNAIRVAMDGEELTTTVGKAIETLGQEIDRAKQANAGSSSKLRAMQRRQELLKVALPLAQRTNEIETTIGSLESKLSAARATLDQSLTDRGQIEQLEARIQQARTAYNEYRNRFNQGRAGAKLVVLRAPERIKIVDQPEDPKYPLSSALKILLAGLGAAIALGGGLVITAEQLDESIRNARDAEYTANIPVIATLPKIEHDTRPERADPPERDGSDDDDMDGAEPIVKSA